MNKNDQNSFATPEKNGVVCRSCDCGSVCADSIKLRNLWWSYVDTGENMEFR